MSLGSLTTPFVPAPTCFSSGNFWAVQPGNGAGDFYIQHGPPLTEDPSCYPPAFLPASTLYYVGGVACPTGYTTACSSTVAKAGVTEVGAVCCPSAWNFGCIAQQPDASTQLAQFPWFTTFGCWSSIKSMQTFPDLPIVKLDSTVYNTMSENAGIIGAYAINIRSRSGDSPVSGATTTASSGPTQLPPSAGQSPSTAAPTDTSSAVGGLSGGAMAGIGLSAGFGVVLVGIAVWLLACRIRRKRRAAAKATPFNFGTDDILPPPPPPPPPPPQYRTKQHELLGSPLPELSGQHVLVELSAETRPHMTETRRSSETRKPKRASIWRRPIKVPHTPPPIPQPSTQPSQQESIPARVVSPAPTWKVSAYIKNEALGPD